MKTSDESVMLHWETGVPDVKEGGREVFWCAIKSGNGGVFHRFLVYLNGYVMSLSDSCYDVPADTKPVGDDGDYEWTGWFQESCDHCDTQWKSDGKVVAWMRLPKYKEQS